MSTDALNAPIDEGTKARFEAEALPHLDAVYRMACSLTSHQAEVEDLVQDTFVRAFRAFSRFELREYGAKPWLMRILHNVFYSAKTRERRRPTLLDDVDFDHFAEELGRDSLDDAGDIRAIDWDGFDEEVKQAIAALQPEYRTVLLLWAIEGLSYKEIAEVCDCALGTIMSRLYRARRLLEGKLKDYAEEYGHGTTRLRP